MQGRKPPLPALTVKLSKYNVDDVALGVCKTGAEEAGVTEVRTSLSEKKFELWREIKVRSEERFSRNAETDLVCRLLLEKKKKTGRGRTLPAPFAGRRSAPRGSSPCGQRARSSARSASGFFFNDTATTEIYTLSLHDALPIFDPDRVVDLDHLGSGIAHLLDRV